MNLTEKNSILREYVSSSRFSKMLEVIDKRTFNIVPVLEHIYDRGNISAVMRSAEAYGFCNFQIIENPNGKFKTANRVSQGTDKWLNIKKFQQTTDCLKSLKSKGYKIYATHLNADISIEDIDFTQASAIILGNEKDGVSEAALEYCDHKFVLPMHGFAQSFNISVAAALCFAHIYNFRINNMQKSGDLNKEEKTELLFSYMCKSVKSAEKILEKSLST